MNKAQEVLERVRNFESNAVMALSQDDYRAYLDERIADAEGWNMLTQEMDAEKGVR